MGAAALMIAVAACSTSQEVNPAAGAANGVARDRGIPVVATVPHLTATLKLRLPLDDYLWSVDDLTRISLARRAIINRCLQGFGVDVVLPRPVTGIGPRTWMERRYGLTDSRDAALVGYGLGERDPSKQPRESDPDLSPIALAVLTGEGAALTRGRPLPTGGCSEEAHRVLNGRASGKDHKADTFLPQRLSMESFELSRRDPRMVEAFDTWSACMRAAGHHYEDPLAPFTDKSAQGVTQFAIDTAIDDVKCKKRTNLVGIWYAVESAYQNVLIEDHRTELDTVATANAATSEVVERVLVGAKKSGSSPRRPIRR